MIDYAQHILSIDKCLERFKEARKEIESQQAKDQ